MEEKERENLIKSIAVHLRDEADCSHDDSDAIEASEEQASEVVSFYIEPLLAAKDKEIERLKNFADTQIRNASNQLMEASRADVKREVAAQSLEKVRDKANLAADALACDNTHRANLYVKELLAIIDKGEKDEG